MHWEEDRSPRPVEIADPEVSLLTGNPPEELLNDNAYVVFLRCKQAPPTGEIRIPLSLVEYVKKQDEKKWVEPNRVCWLGVSQPPFSFIFGEAHCTSHSLDLSIHLTYPTAKSVSSEVSGTASKSMGKVSLSERIQTAVRGVYPRWPQQKVGWFVLDNGWLMVSRTLSGKPKSHIGTWLIYIYIYVNIC